MVSNKLEEISEILLGVSTHEPLLVKVDDTFRLVNYDYGYVLVTEPMSNNIGYSWKDRVFRATPDSDYHGAINIEGEAMIKFKPSDFGYMPTSGNRSVEVIVDEDFSDVEIIAQPDEIMHRLSGVVGEDYLDNVVAPFMEGKPTSYKLPTRGWFRRNGWKKLGPVLEEADIGEKIYIGFDNASWMITKSDPENASIYTRNYNNPFYVETQEICRNFCGVTEPKGFILLVAGWGEGGYHQLGHRMQNKPKIVTKDKKEAMEHIRSQSFADFSGVVEKYMD